MKRWKRLSLLILALAALSLVPAWLLRSQAQQTRPHKPLPPTTQYVDQRGSTLWTAAFAAPLVGFGLFGPDEWYAGYLRGVHPLLTNGIVCVGNMRSGKVLAIARTTHPVTGRTLQNGTLLYVPTGDSFVAAIDLETCQEIWTIDLGDPVTGLACADGRLFATTAAGIRAIDADRGQTMWSHPTTQLITTAPVANNTCVCYVTQGRTLQLLDPRTGALVREIAIDMDASAIVLHARDTAVVAGNSESEADLLRVRAVDLRQRAIRWKANVKVPSLLAAKQINGPVVGEGLVCLSFDDQLFAFDLQSGTERWRWQVPLEPDDGGRISPRSWRPSYTQPLISVPTFHDGLIYATWEYRASAFDATTGREVWQYGWRKSEVFGSPFLPPIVLDDKVVCTFGQTTTASIRLASGSAQPAPVNGALRHAQPLTPSVVACISATLLAALIGAAMLRRWRLLTASIGLILCAIVVRSWFGSYETVCFIGRENVLSDISGQFHSRRNAGIFSQQGTIKLGIWQAVWEGVTPRIALGDEKNPWLYTRQPVADVHTSLDPADTNLGLTSFSWTRRSHPSGTTLGAQSESALMLPHWLVATLLAIAPLAWLTGLWRDRRRYPVGHCEYCGYDLRASKDRCPECGRAISGQRKKDRE